jgi:hypothetical protein
MDPNAKRPIDIAADLFFFAPVGIALELGKHVPELAEQGRQRLEGPLKSAKLVGQMAAAQGRRDFSKHFGGGSGPTDAPASGSATASPESTTSASPKASGLPISDYETLSAQQVIGQLDHLSPADLEAVRLYEATHRNRKTVIERIETLASAGS